MCIVIDLDEVCLVCLHHSQKMHGIFAPDSDTPDLEIAHKISTLSKLKVSVDNESLPDKICDICLVDLRAAWRFHKNCQTAAVVFQSIFRPKVQQEQAETASPPEQVEIEGNQKAVAKERSKVAQMQSASEPDDDCSNDDTNIEILPTNEAALDDNHTEMDINETDAELEATKNVDAEFIDINQSIVEEDYLSVPETVDEESDLVEYYITDDGVLEHQVVAPSKPSTSSKVITKTQQSVTSASSPRKSLLRKKMAENTPTSVEVSKKTQATNLQKLEQKPSHSKANLPKLIENVQQQTQISDIDDEFDLVPKSKPPSQKRKLSTETKAPKICELCGNSYRYQHALTAHMRRHIQDKPFPCELCDKAFVSNVELRRHMRVHTGHKPYGCRYCERRFSDFGSRIKHERTHTGERPYHCGTCGKSFAYPHVLSVHLLTHTGEKRFRCDLCTKGFTKKAYLLTHMEQCHSSGQESKGKRHGNRPHTAFDISMDDTISEAGEENVLETMKSEKFDDCLYATEYANDGDAVSQEGDADCENDDSSNMMIQEVLMSDNKEDEDEDNNEVLDEVVEIQIDDYTIRVR